MALRSITPKEGTPTASISGNGWRSSNGEKTTISGIVVWIKGQSPTWESTPELSPYNERAAYLVNKMLGLRSVPTTVLRLKNGKLVSAQRWVKGKKPNMTHCPPILNLFDYIIRNNDRHAGNWLIKPSGKVWAIDNAYSFTDRGSQVPDCKELPEDDKTKLKKKLQSILAEPQKIHKMLDSLIGKEKTDALISRMADVLAELGKRRRK